MRPRLLVSCLVSLALCASEAGAAPSAKDRAEARQLVVQAQKELKSGSATKAAELFSKANALDPQPQTELEQAKAMIKAKQLVGAAKLLDQVAAGAKAPNQKKLREEAMNLRTELEARIPKLTIKVTQPGAEPVKITVDGEKVDATGPVAVDPGEHEVAARAGAASARRDVTLAEGANETVTLALGGEGGAPKKEDKGGGPAIIPASIAFGLGAVGLGLGIGFGVLAFDEANKVKAACPNNPCTVNPDIQAAYDTSIANGWVSTTAFIVGGVGVATGAVILLATSFGGSKDEKKALVVPYVGPRELGVAGRF